LLDEAVLLLLTGVGSVLVVPLLWKLRAYSTLNLILLLFTADIVMTIEAALYSDLVMIAFLHVFSIPAFFVLIYFDLVKEHRSYSKCFICGKSFESQEEVEAVVRNIGGQPHSFQVHKSCVRVEANERKAFSKKLFRRGIPE
jgi:hypothetical protein